MADSHKKTNWKINRPDLCAKYANCIDSLPRSITPRELDPYVTYLFAYPYLEVIRTLRDVAFAPDRSLNTAKTAKLERILKNADSQHSMHACLSQELPKDYRFDITPRGGDYRELLRHMSMVPNCIKSNDKERVAQIIQQDIDNGGCIKIFGITNNLPQMYLRDYIGLGKNDQVILQVDAIEGGSRSYWTRAEQWISAGRGKELLYGIAASIYLADKLCLETIGLGDFESDEFGELIGCPEVRVYDTTESQRKIGVPPRIKRDGTLISEGVFANRIIEQTYQRTLRFDRDELLASGISQDCIIADPNERWAQNPQKQKEMMLYSVAQYHVKQLLGQANL
jgi:hypothetical protein